jgi:hypothetical protein
MINSHNNNVLTNQQKAAGGCDARLLRLGKARFACDDRRVEFDQEYGFVDGVFDGQAVGGDLSCDCKENAQGR